MAFTASALLSKGATDAKQVRRDYINKYAQDAVREMYKSGVPASITLAQGCLESSDGKSPLAIEANNHFGIKCSGWTGPGFYQDDDAPNECFRSYPSALESFDDHSNFLRSRPRYSSLFELESTDYKGWAHGLKRAGYATDPSYADRLIRIIEEFELHQYDLQGAALIAADRTATAAAPPVPSARQTPDVLPVAEQVAPPTTPAVTPASDPVEDSPAPPAEKRPAAVSPEVPPAAAPVKEEPSVAASEPIASTSNVSVFESLKKNISGKIFVPAVEPVNVFGERKVFVNNGASYVIARRGDTFKGMSEEMQLGYWQLPKYNELPMDAKLKEGQKVYVTPKRSSASVPYYVVREGDTIHSISQELGVKSKFICSLNGLQSEEPLKPGIRLSVAGD
jgi:LysM repeat protein